MLVVAVPVRIQEAKERRRVAGAEIAPPTSTQPFVLGDDQPCSLVQIQSLRTLLRRCQYSVICTCNDNKYVYN